MSTTQTGIATDFISFSRASLATVTDSDGKIKWAPHNLLTHSESFDAASWTKEPDVVVTPNDALAPNGTMTADKVTFGVANRQLLRQLTISGRHTYGVYIKGTAGETITFDNGGVAPIAGGAVTLTGGWDYCTFTSNATNDYFDISTYGGATARTIWVWGAHLYRSDLGGMQNNPSAFPTYNPTSVKNLLGNTENFAGSSWNLNSATVSTDAIIAPNGLSSADKITAALINVYQTLTLATGVERRFSCYLKQSGSATSCELYIFDTVTTGFVSRASFSFTNGVATNIAGSGATMTPVGDGWYRCSIRGTVANASNTYGIYNTTEVCAWGAQLSDSASLDPYVPNYGAAPTSAAYYGPRRDFDASGSCKGLLVEEQRTNLLLHSAAFNDAVWTANNIVSTGMANVAIAPDGTMTADQIVPVAGATVESPSVYVVVNQTVEARIFSCFMKANTYTKGFIRIGGSVSADPAPIAVFDLVAGTVLATQGTSVVATITSVGSGWYRCSLRYPNGPGSSGTGQAYAPNVGCVSDSYTVGQVHITSTTNGTSGIYIWGAQLEAGTFATSYIPTGASQVTRSADLANVNVQAFPYSTGQGALVASIMPNAFTSSGHPSAVLSDAAFANLALVGQIISTTVIRAGAIDVGGVNQAIFPVTTSMSVGLKLTSGMAYAQNDVAASLNGATALTDNSANMPSGATELFIGRLSGQYFNGHIRQITYLPRRISNADLQARTA